MNRYNGFDDRSCEAQFDDDLCKRHRPKEYDGAERECSCCCINCPPGPAGPQGPAGGVFNYADFYALMPPSPRGKILLRRVDPHLYYSHTTFENNHLLPPI